MFGSLAVRRIEWPTLGVAAALYLIFGLVTWYHATLPWWLLLPIGAILVTLHGSLQHEVVHGHPTPWRWVNAAVVFPSLWLWLPFEAYRRSHLEHHDDAYLTDPLADPESFYLTADRWEQTGPAMRALFWIRNTLAGRLLLGPLFCALGYWWQEIHALRHGERRRLAREWLPHLAGVALVLGWVLGVCGMGFLEYLLFFAYPGVALTLLRSFLEHQARAPVSERTVLVEAGPFFSLLFFNNNLHALHHAEPDVAWYDLPTRYRLRRAELLKANGNYLYRSYAEIIARYLLWPKEAPVHPAERPLGETAGLMSATPLRESPAFAPHKGP